MISLQSIFLTADLNSIQNTNPSFTVILNL